VWRIWAAELGAICAVLWLCFGCFFAVFWRDGGLGLLHCGEGKETILPLIYMLCFAGFATLQIGPFSRFVRAMFSFFGALYVAGRMA
jgi:hypothetical protein